MSILNFFKRGGKQAAKAASSPVEVVDPCAEKPDQPVGSDDEEEKDA